jgi:DNA-binding transcriptional LysR family regulator
MDVRWLAVFREVAEQGSITTAARSLGYTQSAVSRHVSALESDLGVVLFDRMPRGVRLTEPGHRLLTHAYAVLDRLETARQDLADLELVETGRLRVGAFASADAALVPRALAAFRAEHPRVVVTLAEGLSADLLRRVLTDELDLAVVAPRGPVDDSRLVLRPLMDESLLVALPRGHRLARRRTLRLAELADESWIAGSATPEETLISAALRSGWEPHVEYVLGEWLAKLGFVAAGLGITLVPALAASAARSDVLLKRLHADDASVREIYVATLHGATLSPAAQRFSARLDDAADTLRTEIGERVPTRRRSQPA